MLWGVGGRNVSCLLSWLIHDCSPICLDPIAYARQFICHHFFFSFELRAMTRDNFYCLALYLRLIERSEQFFMTQKHARGREINFLRDSKCPMDLLKALMSSRRVLFVIKLLFFCVWKTMRHLKFIGIPVNRFSIQSTFFQSPAWAIVDSWNERESEN